MADEASPGRLDRIRAQLRSPDTRGQLLLALVLVVVAAAMAAALGLQFVRDPTRLAPTRDPAWYTWRTRLLLENEPSLLLTKEGPLNMLAGGYRITTPVLGAVVHRVAGIDTYRFTALFMVALPILTSLALGAFAYQHRKDGFAFVLTMLFAFGMLLTTPFVGYLDQAFVLYILALSLPFLEPARTSWGARSALALLLFLAALTHPSTTIFFALTLAAVTGVGFLASRLSFRRTLREYGPPVLSAAAGVVAGLLAWRVGLWGVSASFSDAVLVQPYPQSFFEGRLGQWWASLKPRYTVPLVLIAVGWFGWRVFRRRPVDWHIRISVLWLLPLLGAFGFVFGFVYPYYRFFNATLALLLLGGAGAWLIVRGARLLGERLGGRMGGPWPGRLVILLPVVAAGILLFELNSLYYQPALNRWERESQFMSRTNRVALAGVRGYAEAEADAPIVLMIHPHEDRVRAWAISKLNSNIMLAGLDGDQADRTFVYVGTVADFQQNRPTVTGFEVFDLLSREFLANVQEGLATFDEPPMVFLVKGFNSKLGPESDNPGTWVTPEVRLLEGPGWAEPSPAAVVAAEAARTATAAIVNDPPPRFSNVGHLARAGVGLVLLLILPGLLALPWFEVRGLPMVVALLPGLSLAMVVAAAVLVITVHRAPFGPVDGWVTFALAVGGGAALGIVGWRRRRSLATPPDEGVVMLPEATPEDQADRSGSRVTAVEPSS